MTLPCNYKNDYSRLFRSFKKRFRVLSLVFIFQILFFTCGVLIIIFDSSALDYFLSKKNYYSRLDYGYIDILLLFFFFNQLIGYFFLNACKKLKENNPLVKIVKAGSIEKICNILIILAFLFASSLLKFSGIAFNQLEHRILCSVPIICFIFALTIDQIGTVKIYKAIMNTICYTPSIYSKSNDSKL